MATTNTTMETAKVGASGPTAVIDSAAGTARQVADTVASAAGEAAARVPDVAQGTREALTEANRLVRGGSDQTLQLVGASAIGFAVGLLIGGASRLLVVLSLLPVALIATTLLERNDAGSTTRTTATRLQGR